MKPLNKKAPNIKLHYFLFAVELVYKVEGGEMGRANVNVAVTNPDMNINARVLGRAQQGAQVNFWKKVKSQLEIVDAVITAVSYLGHMTPQYFNAPPEGMKLQEQAKAVVEKAQEMSKAPTVGPTTNPPDEAANEAAADDVKPA